MQLAILSPEGKIFEGEIESATLPGSKGSFQVLKGHAPIISSLDKGSIRIKGKNLPPASEKLLAGRSADERSVNVNGGFVEVLQDKVAILVEA